MELKNYKKFRKNFKHPPGVKKKKKTKIVLEPPPPPQPELILAQYCK